MNDNTTKTLAIGAVLLALAMGVVFVLQERNNQQPMTQTPPWNQPWQPNGPEPWQEPPVEPPKDFTLDEAVASIDEAELKKDLEYLASQELEGRMTGKRGNVIAADFIKKKFESYGLQTMYHKFTSRDIGRRIQGVNPGPNREQGDDFSQNIYAWIEGIDPDVKDEVIVIGAHMDHIGYGPSMSRSRQIKVHPGADDNASGTVALLQIAKAFSKMKDKCRRTIVFQAYSAEEMGLHGSRFYCNNPTFPRSRPDIKKHVFMLNLDMVGFLGKGQYFAGFYAGESSVDVSRIINQLNGKYNFARQITSRGSGGSDHASFYNKRIPVAFLHTGGHPYYHTPQDTPDRINYNGIEKVSKYAFELCYNIQLEDAAPRFNMATFKVMEYIHDHGHPETPFMHPWHRHDHDHPGHTHE